MTPEEKFRDYPILDDVYQAEFHQRRLAAKWGRVRPGETVVSVGCNGGHEAAFAPAGCQIHGVDLSIPSLEKARERLASATYGDAEHLPFKNQSMDVVMLGNVLMYVPDPVAAVREAMRVAKRAVIGSTPHEDGPWGKALFAGGKTHEWNLRYLTVAQLAEMMTAGRAFQLNLEFLMVGSKPYYIIFDAGLL